MRAGYAAAVSAALAAVVVLAVLPYANLPYVPKATVTITRTAWSTATETSTVTHTVTTTETETETTTKTTTAWRTETTTETKTQTATETRTETQTLTETLTITTTTTTIKEVYNFNVYKEPDAIIDLVNNANESVLAFIVMGSIWVENQGSYERLVNFTQALINASQRGVDVLVAVRKDRVCWIGNETLRNQVINLINQLNQTLPNPVVILYNIDDSEALTSPYGDVFAIVKAYIDNKYLVMITAGDSNVISYDYSWVSNVMNAMKQDRPIWGGC